jgi:hypothetical protein
MAFKYRLELENGEPADPPTIEAAVPNWAPGDTIPLGADRSLWVVGIRPSEEPNENSVPRGQARVTTAAERALKQRGRCSLGETPGLNGQKHEPRSAPDYPLRAPRRTLD